MNKLKGMLFYASAIALSGSLAAYAQEDDDSERKLGTVTVTGSLIQGTPEDAALPVDVLTTEDLRLQGSPSALDIIKSLPVSSGAARPVRPCARLNSSAAARFSFSGASTR